MLRTSPGEQSHRRNLFGSSPRTNGQYDFAGFEKHQTNPEKEPGDTAAIFVAKDFDFGSVYNLALRR
jgi:hypothetical protein